MKGNMNLNQIASKYRTHSIGNKALCVDSTRLKHRAQRLTSWINHSFLGRPWKSPELLVGRCPFWL